LRLRAEQLPAALARGLAGIYLVSGDEPLLVGEAADAIRAAARSAGCADRQVFFIDRSFSWDDLRLASQSLSLFAERRLFELRMPSGKPDKGAALLAELAAQKAFDLIYLVITDKLDRKTSDTPWVQAIEKHGAWVPIQPVELAALPAWLRARAKMLHLEVDYEASQLIVDRVEGNLLAAQQELEKLGLLANGAPIGVDLVLRSVGDSARYDVFQLGEGRRRRRRRPGAPGIARTEKRGSGTDADLVGAGSGDTRNVAGALHASPADMPLMTRSAWLACSSKGAKGSFFNRARARGDGFAAKFQPLPRA